MPVQSKHLEYYSSWNVINASALLAGDNTLEFKLNGFSVSTKNKISLLGFMLTLSVALRRRGTSTVQVKMDDH